MNSLSVCYIEKEYVLVTTLLVRGVVTSNSNALLHLRRVNFKHYLNYDTRELHVKVIVIFIDFSWGDFPSLCLHFSEGK
jgi:hypothetical protein